MIDVAFVFFCFVFYLWNKCISSRLRVYGKCLDPETCSAQFYKMAKVIKN